MKISYKFFNVNNLTYRFNQEIASEKFSETYNFNIKSTTVTSNRLNSVAFIELKILLETKLENSTETFRSLSFDFKYIYRMEEFEEISDEDIQVFIIDHGLESAVSSVKDVIKNITNIDYQPTINIDIPKFPMNTSKYSSDQQ